jgi:nucleoside 2-deoxyribosyltransferase
LPLLRESQSRYASAVEIARAVNDPAASHFQEALANVDRVIAFLTQDAEESTAPVTDDTTLGRKLLDKYTKDVVAGKVSETRQQALDSALSQLGHLVGNSPDDVPGLTIQISRGLDAAKSMLPLTATSQDASTLPAGSRAEAVWKRFSGLKLYLAQDLTRQISQRESGSETVFSEIELLKKCGQAQTSLHKPGRSDKTVSGYETDTLRQLACDVRAVSLCHHLTLVSPLWPSLPLPQDPNAVFFSGGDLLRESLVHVCAKKQLKLLPRAAPKDFASSRWDQLRACHVALFDFTDYVRPDPDQPNLAVTAPVAAIAYELGVALTLGRPVIVLAKESQEPPFDVDVEPTLLKGDGRDDARLSDAIDDAMYGLQRGGEASSIAAASANLEERFLSAKEQLSRPQGLIVESLLKLIDDDVVRDPVKFRRFVEPVLGSVWPNSPLMVFPAWRGSYPEPTSRRCFHVTAFKPKWAGKTTKIITATCEAAKPRVEYVRGDLVPDPDIIRSIWDNLCQASHLVVDLTGLNANVALELGIAHALGRNVLLVTQDSVEEVDFPSLAKLRVHRYSLTGKPGMKPLRQALDKFLVQGA